MSYIKFDKKQLVNLEYSLTRELIRSNRAGAYASQTIIGCHTRKYHGLLVVPQPALDDDNHVLLSNFDETVIQHNAEFNLGIHKYPGGVYYPRGHKYLHDFSSDPIPNSIYHVGDLILKREMLFSQLTDRFMIRYTLVDAHSPTKLRFRPFLAFRNVHRLSKANIHINSKYEEVPNGIRVKLYSGYSYLYMQFSKSPEYTHVPDWNYNIEYQMEMERGYEYQEDLYVPGFFEIDIKKGESVVFCAGTTEIETAAIKRSFSSEVSKRIPRDNFENCLINAAQQFIVKKGKRTDIIAGFPWFGRWGRDTFIAAPGLTLVLGEEKLFQALIDTMIRDMKGPLFPNFGIKNKKAYNSADASLWFIWSLQQYAIMMKKGDEVWKIYGSKIRNVLEGYRSGAPGYIRMLDNGLIWAGQHGLALTWMDAVVNGKPVTPRYGLPVEINALWYNAVCFALELAERNGDKKFVRDWKPIADNIPEAFRQTFWYEQKSYLADYVDGDFRDVSVRPNQVIATSLPYSPLDEESRRKVLEVVRNELLTPRGLRSLAPKNPLYMGVCHGDQKTRDEAYHQGNVWPWLLGHFVEGYLKIYGKSGLPFVKSLYAGFEGVMTEHGIGTISEIYDGDPPHAARGALSQAWSVAELLRINWMIGGVGRRA
ncbi:MAG: amylo-alpha-1,6-glucosidase [Bacteroidales bacterium]|nr:amylo-alpha-1,6-glucosidase [Bacteroidales bacterium]